VGCCWWWWWKSAPDEVPIWESKPWQTKSAEEHQEIKAIINQSTENKTCGGTTEAGNQPINQSSD
jgi:hypothetical protein